MSSNNEFWKLVNEATNPRNINHGYISRRVVNNVKVTEARQIKETPKSYCMRTLNKDIIYVKSVRSRDLYPIGIKEIVDRYNEDILMHNNSWEVQAPLLKHNKWEYLTKLISLLEKLQKRLEEENEMRLNYNNVYDEIDELLGNELKLSEDSSFSIKTNYDKEMSVPQKRRINLERTTHTSLEEEEFDSFRMAAMISTSTRRMNQIYNPSLSESKPKPKDNNPNNLRKAKEDRIMDLEDWGLKYESRAIAFRDGYWDTTKEAIRKMEIRLNLRGNLADYPFPIPDKNGKLISLSISRMRTLLERMIEENNTKEGIIQYNREKIEACEYVEDVKLVIFTREPVTNNITSINEATSKNSATLTNAKIAESIADRYKPKPPKGPELRRVRM